MVFCEKKTAKRSFSIMASLLFYCISFNPTGPAVATKRRRPAPERIKLSEGTNAFAYDVQAAASKPPVLIRENSLSY